MVPKPSSQPFLNPKLDSFFISAINQANVYGQSTFDWRYSWVRKNLCRDYWITLMQGNINVSSFYESSASIAELIILLCQSLETSSKWLSKSTRSRWSFFTNATFLRSSRDLSGFSIFALDLLKKRNNQRKWHKRIKSFSRH